MASSAISCHARSTSLPSTPHPRVHHIEHHLCRLRSSKAISASPFLMIRELQDLEDSVDELLLLPLSRQAITNDSVGGLIEGSLRLLDACSTIKDALSQTKQSAQEVQSVLRRRCEARTEVKKFMSTRKIVKKAIQKGLKDLKDKGNKCSSADEALSLLCKAHAQIGLAFQSLLLFINGEKASSNLSLISKPKRVSCADEEGNQFAIVDAAVQSLLSKKGRAETVQSQLQKLGLCIQDFEDGVDSLFRHLIKTRVSLLNIINH